MNQKIVLITGASSGFGYLTTLHLASLGYNVIATMRNLNKQEALLDEARKRNVADLIDVVKLDVTKREEVTLIKEYVIEKYSKLDILVNNAGYCLGGLIEYANLDEWEEQLKTNVLSIVNITQAFMPLMRKSRSGKIINIGSGSGRFGYPGLGAYCTSKFALSGFSESLRLELLPFNVYVSLIEAGAFKTNIWDKSLSHVNLDCDDDYSDFLNFVHTAAKNTSTNAQDPMKLVHLIEKICKVKKPRFRYQIGKSVRIFSYAKIFLPWTLIEKVVIKKVKKGNKFNND